MTSESQNDDLLKPWLLKLRTMGHKAAEAELEQLIKTQIEPVINFVIRRTLRPASGTAAGMDAPDLAQEALVEWLSKILELRDGNGDRPICDVRGLAATIGYRVCYAWFRKQSPRRNALKNRLHYVLTRHKGFSLWTSNTNFSIAGFTTWSGQAPIPSEKLRLLPDNEKFSAQSWTSDGVKLIELVSAILDSAGGPVAFDDMVSVVAAILNIKDEPSATIEEERGGPEIASSADVAWQAEKRIFLERVWAEVLELPRAQRVALLLNLRESGGGGCLALFPVIGVATLRQIADALEIPADQFAELWSELPLDDTKIAKLLKRTRQQVINLRKSARERLLRRLKGFF